MTETRLQDVIVPDHFNGYSLELTTDLSRLRRPLDCVRILWLF